MINNVQPDHILGAQFSPYVFPVDTFGNKKKNKNI